MLATRDIKSPMAAHIQIRKPQTDETPAHGLARRATDHEFRGMKIHEDDSDQAWADFEDALSKIVETSEVPTQPGELQ